MATANMISGELLVWKQPLHESGRWFLNDKPVHAGSTLEMRTKGSWLTVRIEWRLGSLSVPHAYIRIHGRSFSCPINVDFDKFRWPSKA